MTDIKRMEKPTDLMCEKCGKPLVIKWGKHGSFIACTGYPDFSSEEHGSRPGEARERDRRSGSSGRSKEIEKRLEKIRARYPELAVSRGEHGRFVVYPWLRLPQGD